MGKNDGLIGRKIAKAIFTYKLIEPGEKVLMAVSGGKDSLTLAYHLSKKAGKFSIPFEMEAVHIKSDFSAPENVDQMKKVLAGWDIPLTVIDVPVVDRLKPGRKMNCYWCSTQRRMELMCYAEQNGFAKIALGHHLDDIVETFFMNMVQKGELSTMLPLMKYDRYPNTVIRPLAMVREKDIIKFSQDQGFHQYVCQCGYDDTSKRKDVRKVMDFITEEEGEFAIENIYKAMHNPNLRYLIHTEQYDPGKDKS